MHSTEKPWKQDNRKFQNPLKEVISSFELRPSDRFDERPYIQEYDGVLALHLNKLSIQSEMRLDAPDELVLGYTRAMMCFMLFLQDPKQIAMIGLGGGSLAKYCYRYLPASKILVLEINAEVTALRNEFVIPPDDGRFHVMLADGADYVHNASSHVDVLIVDGFDATGQASQLGTQQFYDHCFAKLNEGGVLAVNLWFCYPSYEKYVARISKSFSGKIVIVDAGGGSTNKIILAVKSVDFPPSAATLRQRADSLCKTHPLNYEEKANQIQNQIQNKMAEF